MFHCLGQCSHNSNMPRLCHINRWRRSAMVCHAPLVGGQHGSYGDLHDGQGWPGGDQRYRRCFLMECFGREGWNQSVLLEHCVAEIHSIFIDFIKKKHVRHFCTESSSFNYVVRLKMDLWTPYRNLATRRSSQCYVASVLPFPSATRLMSLHKEARPVTHSPVYVIIDRSFVIYSNLNI